MDGILSCGHPPTTPRHEMTTGYGTDAEGRTYCFACCHARSLARVAEGDFPGGYLSSDGKHVTTWPGDPLMRVTDETVRRVGFGWRTTRTYLRAVDESGRRWHGTSPGRGMYVRMRPSAR